MYIIYIKVTVNKIYSLDAGNELSDLCQIHPIIFGLSL